MSTFMYFSLNPPRQWRAGVSAPGTANEKEFFFSCCKCGAEDCEIAGILANKDNPTFTGIGLITDPLTEDQKARGVSPRNIRPAMYCQPCFDAEIAARKLEIAAGQENARKLEQGLASGTAV